MSKKYFIVADVHSFYNEMMKSLDDAGFDMNNPDHIFVSCGDLLDRGGYPTNCLLFVNSIPKERKILIRGNHEDLLEECLARHMFGWHDYHNGTAETIHLIAKYEKVVKGKDGDEFELCKNSELLNTYLNSTVDYAIVDNNIFVHGWVPYYYDGNDNLVYNIEYGDWKRARWDNGMELWSSCGKVPECTVFCGHWHTSYGHSILHNKCSEFGEDAIFEPFIDDGIVALDACTAHSGKVNCYVLEVNNE